MNKYKTNINKYLFLIGTLNKMTYVGLLNIYLCTYLPTYSFYLHIYVSFCLNIYLCVSFRSYNHLPTRPFIHPSDDRVLLPSISHVHPIHLSIPTFVNPVTHTQTTNQPINHSINQSTNQPVKLPPPNQPIHPSIYKICSYINVN